LSTKKFKKWHNALNTVTSARKIFLACTGYNTKTPRNEYLYVKVAYLKLKPITVLINTEVPGRDKQNTSSYFKV